jgi:signal recognition particle receptor subunit beta
VIFVVDSTDIERLQTAADELSAMLNEEELKDAALLVFANKQDQPGAKGAGDISEALRLGELRDRSWSIVACSAVEGSGVNEGMDWLVVSKTDLVFSHDPVRVVLTESLANGELRVINNSESVQAIVYNTNSHRNRRCT